MATIQTKEINNAVHTIYSNGNNYADFYTWSTVNDAIDKRIGYFVSFNTNSGYIDICTGDDIFGVTVDDSGFAGGYNEVNLEDGSIAAVVATGVVSVRCESTIEVGDCVVSNEIGRAKKSIDGCGYRVIALSTDNDDTYAVIMLAVQADKIDRLGRNIQVLNNRIKAAEDNALSAMNLANTAYNKAEESDTTVESIGGTVNDVNDKVDEANKNASDALDAANKAKEIAESTKTFAMAECANAFNLANDAWAKADNVATETYSLCAKIDQYSVGEYSQARGLTLEQAQEILVPGMIYVPTKHGEVEYHTEVYEYTNAPEKVESIKTIETPDVNKVYYDGKEYLYYNGDSWQNLNKMPTYERIFTPGYLYQWGYLEAIQKYGWITIDKDHKIVNYNSEIETNDASKAVYFYPTEPSVAEGEDFGYWYTDADEISDKDGNVGAYNPYTLYKWDGDHWLAVATLVGNCNNRAVSLVSQTTNSLSAEITNARGSTASIGERITNTESEVYSIAQWTIDPDTGNQYSLASIKQTADDAGASIANIVEWAGPDGVVNTSSIVQSINESGSEVYIEADHIRLEGIMTMDSNITITEDGKIVAKNAEIEGKITASSGYIGDETSGFEIGKDAIYNKYSQDVAGVNVDYKMDSPSSMNTLYSLKKDLGFVYVGSGGIGTMSVITTNNNSANNEDAIKFNSYMADGKLFSNSAEITGAITATSGYIGDKSNGFAIGSKAIYNVRLSPYDNETRFYMTSPNELNSDDQFAGGSSVGGFNSYVYVGADGIGAMKVAFDTGNSNIVAQTYIEDGDLFSDSATIITSNIMNSSIVQGTIGEGTYKWNVGSNAESDNAYLYCGSETIASSGGIIMPDTNHVYLGTDGMSYTLGTSDNNLDYTTLIKSGNILVYGDNEPGHSRATHLHYNGIDFFYAGSNVISQNDSLVDYEVGGIGVSKGGDFGVRANNTMNFYIGVERYAKIDSSGMYLQTPSVEIATEELSIGRKRTNDDGSSYYTYSTGETGFVKVLVDTNTTTNTYNYLYFVHGVLVGVYYSQPSTDDENLTCYS